MQCIALMDNQALSSHIHHLDPNVKADRLQTNMSELEKSLKQKKTAQEAKRAESASNTLTATTETRKKIGRYDLPDSTQKKNPTMTLIQTRNKPMQKEQSTKHGERGNKRDHFTSLNTVQRQPQQQKGWKFLPLTPQRSSLSSSWRGSCHATRISVPPSKPSLLLPDESAQQRRASSDPSELGDPDIDEYHTNLRTRPSPMDKQTKSQSQSSESFEPNAPTSSPVHKLMGRGKGV